MRFSASLFAVMCLALAFSATAFADYGTFSWQTTPILGTEVTYTGDVVVNTGPIPFTIPHDSDPSDPEYNGSASPSITVFYVGQSIATGSGMWIIPGDVYTITGIFQQLTGGSRMTEYQEVYTGSPDGFVMESFTSVHTDPTYQDLYMLPISGSALIGLSDADIGNWTYTESWTDATTTVSATNDFSVAAVPEPGALLLFGSVLLGLAAYRRKLA